MVEPAEHRVVDNAEARRYELLVDGLVVSAADYRRHDDIVLVSHVETVPHRRGQGMSDRLMRGVLDDLRDRGLRIDPLCWVAVEFVRDHPDDADLLAS